MKVFDGIGSLNIDESGMKQVVRNLVDSNPKTSTYLPAALTMNSTLAGIQREANTFHCEHGALLGPLGLFVQGLLAFIAFGALVVKRFCEPKYERRSWLIWFFDTSKQAIGAAVIHFANVFLASVFHGDPCTWYIVSFLLDSTLGLIVIYIGLQITQCIARHKGNKHMLLGEYGSPPKCYAWAVQCGLYVLVMLIEKLLMTLLVLFNFWKDVRKLIMSPIKNPQAELILVMFVIPFIVNAFIFWVVDNFLKKKWKVPRTINSNESAVKYLRSAGMVKYYSQVAHGEEESDELLSVEEDIETATVPLSNNIDMLQSNQNADMLLSNQNPEQLGLLSTPSASLI